MATLSEALTLISGPTAPAGGFNESTCIFGRGDEEGHVHLDSLDAVELLLVVEGTFSIEIPAELSLQVTCPPKTSPV
jgi:hypothetical protein